jgi:hypothetical protein
MKRYAIILLLGFLSITAWPRSACGQERAKAVKQIVTNLFDNLVKGKSEANHKLFLNEDITVVGITKGAGPEKITMLRAADLFKLWQMDGAVPHSVELVEVDVLDDTLAVVRVRAQSDYMNGHLRIRKHLNEAIKFQSDVLTLEQKIDKLKKVVTPTNQRLIETQKDLEKAYEQLKLHIGGAVKCYELLQLEQKFENFKKAVTPTNPRLIEMQNELEKAREKLKLNLGGIVRCQVRYVFTFTSEGGAWRIVSLVHETRIP